MTSLKAMSILFFLHFKVYKHVFLKKKSAHAYLGRRIFSKFFGGKIAKVNKGFVKIVLRAITVKISSINPYI